MGGWNRKKGRRGRDDDSSGGEEQTTSEEDSDGADSEYVESPKPRDRRFHYSFKREDKPGSEAVGKTAPKREPRGDRKLHYSGQEIYEPDGSSVSSGRKLKKVVFNQKPKWKHKKHQSCVV